MDRVLDLIQQQVWDATLPLEIRLAASESRLYEQSELYLVRACLESRRAPYCYGVPATFPGDCSIVHKARVLIVPSRFRFLGSLTCPSSSLVFYITSLRNS